MDTNQKTVGLTVHPTIWSVARPKTIISAIGALIEQLQTWSDRARQRQALAALSDHQLKDIGLSRADTMRETVKPFWQD